MEAPQLTSEVAREGGYRAAVLACTAGTLGAGSILCVPGIGLIGLGLEAISLMVMYCNRAGSCINIYNPKIGQKCRTAT